MMANNFASGWFLSFVLLVLVVPSQSHVFGSLLSSLSRTSQDPPRPDHPAADSTPPLILSIYDEHDGKDPTMMQETNPRIERGQTVQIAIQPIDPETRIVRVDNITFTQYDDTATSIMMGRGGGGGGRTGRIKKAQRAVRNGKADARFAGLTCWDGELCMVETKLLDKFFTNSIDGAATSSTITAQGFVTVSPPGRTRGGGLEVHEVSMTLDLMLDEDELMMEH